MIDTNRLLKGYTSEYRHFYNYGDTHVLRPHLLDPMRHYRSHVLSVAFTRYHPAYKGYVNVHNMLSVTECGAWSELCPIKLLSEIEAH